MSDPHWEDYYREEDRRREQWSNRYDAYNGRWGFLYLGLLISSVVTFLLGVFFSMALVWIGVALFTAAFLVCIYCIARITKGPPPGWEP